MTSSTTTTIVIALRRRDAPRVATTTGLEGFLDALGFMRARRNLDVALPTLVEAGFLRRVQKGLFLNTLAQPPAVLDEVAPFLRSGAVISLQRLLGATGVANNPTPLITAVVPLSAERPAPSLGQVNTALGAFRFHGIQESVLLAGNPEDRLIALGSRPIPGKVPLATPEKALIDWIYLAHTPRNRIGGEPPAWDMDVTLLDRARFLRLARAAEMTRVARDWFNRCRANQDLEDREGMGPG